MGAAVAVTDALSLPPGLFSRRGLPAVSLLSAVLAAGAGVDSSASLTASVGAFNTAITAARMSTCGVGPQPTIGPLTNICTNLRAVAGKLGHLDGFEEGQAAHR